jgi:uncharacterized protein YndB with AHSA1/START domain
MPATDAASNATIASRAIVGSRVFDAPRELGWKAWTDPRHIARWWGPNGFQNTIHRMDVRPGGAWEFVMHGPDGRDYANKIIYREIVEPERIRYSHVSGPLFEATVTFTAEGRKTRVDMEMLFESAELRDRVASEYGAVEGLQQTLDHLAGELRVMATGAFVISRTYAVPRDLMWKVWTDEEHLAKWFGPKGTTLFHSKNDLRPSGTYLYGMRAPNGEEWWGRWVYREIVKPEKLVFTISFADADGNVKQHPVDPKWPLQWLSVVTFSESGGRTTVTVHWTLLQDATAEERATFEAGFDSMNGGWSGTFEQLTSLLEKEKKR